MKYHLPPKSAATWPEPRQSQWGGLQSHIKVDPAKASEDSYHAAAFRIAGRWYTNHLSYS